MPRSNPPRRVVIFSRYWRQRSRELSYVIRSVAGAASRSGPVNVLVPGAPTGNGADGAFDVIGLGAGEDGDWPGSPAAVPALVAPVGDIAITDELNDALVPLLKSLGPFQRVFSISGSAPRSKGMPVARLGIVRSGAGGDEPVVGLHVPVNPLAGSHRHNGLGFVDYILVLSDRSGDHELPPEAAAWLTAGMHTANVVVVEDAKASVWRGRALRGIVTVDTRTDLWRLISHARVCIDLAPGALIARECVESLRFGTPIIVPEDAPAGSAHAAAGGGLTFADMSDLLHCAQRFDDAAFRLQCSSAGRDYADSNFGDPSAFVDNVDRLLQT